MVDAITAVILSSIGLDSIPAMAGGLDFLDSLWLNDTGIKYPPRSLLPPDPVPFPSEPASIGARMP